MDKKEFKYDAFISYRHCELDKFVAVNLHRILETYELPKELKQKLNIKNKAFKRVFRDQEELPLTSNLEDPIIEALENSKYLIVICSPRLKDSLWCRKEIDTFKKLRGRKNIFCVLIEGEPADSFPEEVLYDYKEKVVNGKTKKEKIMVEPLAADVRGKNNREVLKKLKEEKLRLIAPMYNLDYDDLRQRHKIWRQKHMIHTSLAIAAIAILFLIYSLFMIIKINLQQNILAEYHALSLVDQAKGYLEKDDRYNAVKSSYQAITDFYDVVMPYTPEAEYMLTESLGAYDAGLSYKAINGLKVDGVVSYITTSPSKYAAIYDESEKVTLFNSKTFDVIGKYDAESFNEYKFTFASDDIFVYVSKDGSVCLINTNDGSIIKKIDGKYISVISNENYISYIDEKNLYIYNIKEDKVNTISTKDSYMKELYFSFDGKYIFSFTEKKSYDISKEDYLTIHTISVDDAKEINKLTIQAGYVSGVTIIDNNAYFLFNNTFGTKYNIVLLSYNYINGNTNYVKTYDNKWGKLIKRSYPNGNHIAITNYDTVYVLESSNGEVVDTYSLGEEIIGMYSYVNNEVYLTFLKNGKVIYVNEEAKTSVEYLGKYELNLDNYSKVGLSENGYLLIPTNDNRVILYEPKANEDVKKEDIELDYIKDDSISINDYDKVKEEYNVKNKSLVKKIFYGMDDEILFVNYTNGDIAIYNVKTKKLLKTLDSVGKVNHYFGEDKYSRLYIGDVSDSYILDDEYNLVGHIKGLAKLENDRVIITSDKKYYSIKIYNLNELKNMAKEYLGNFEEKEFANE